MVFSIDYSFYFSFLSWQRLFYPPFRCSWWLPPWLPPKSQRNNVYGAIFPPNGAQNSQCSHFLFLVNLSQWAPKLITELGVKSCQPSDKFRLHAKGFLMAAARSVSNNLFVRQAQQCWNYRDFLSSFGPKHIVYHWRVIYELLVVEHIHLRFISLAANCNPG